MTRIALTSEMILPHEPEALLVGRVWSKAQDGPCLVLVRNAHVLDITPLGPTMSALLERQDLVATLQAGSFQDLGSLDSFLEGSAGQLLAPVDLQAVKAAGVTFADSMLERVIEEQARGDASRALEIRQRLAPVIGDNLKGVAAGSEKAAQVKALLQEMNLWSQYLEVGIGPTRKFSRSLSRCPPSVVAPRLVFIRFPSGTIRNRRSCYPCAQTEQSSARHWAMM